MECHVIVNVHFYFYDLWTFEKDDRNEINGNIIIVIRDNKMVYLKDCMICKHLNGAVDKHTFQVIQRLNLVLP
jgi:hypothetical protein